jgi:DnaJ-class molecular chaperone
MKPKQYVSKYSLDKTESFNHRDFISDLTSDFLATIQYLQSVNQLPLSRFDTVVKEMRSKWDSISIKCKGEGLPEFLWDHFYINVIMSTKENLFGDQLKKKREAEEKEKAKRERYNRNDNFFQYGGSFNDNLWEELLKRMFDTFNLFNSRFSLSIPEDSFQFLGLTSEASIDDINQSYRTMSLKFHPDKGGSQESFIKLTEAKNKCTMYAQNKV